MAIYSLPITYPLPHLLYSWEPFYAQAALLSRGIENNCCKVVELAVTNWKCFLTLWAVSLVLARAPNAPPRRR